jgi:hypothetical protein
MKVSNTKKKEMIANALLRLGLRKEILSDEVVDRIRRLGWLIDSDEGVITFYKE